MSYLRQNIIGLLIALQVLLCHAAFAQSTVIYQDDFEGTVSGWSDNRTDFDPDTTTFLGPFDVNMNSTTRSFTVPAGAQSLNIEFDFLRFDSWDNFAQFGFDRFEVDIDGTQIFSLPFPNPQAARSGSSGNVNWSHTPITGRVELAYISGQFWFDQIHRYVITVNNPGTNVTLTLRTAVSQAFDDESGAFDNFLVTADLPPVTEITAVAENYAPIDGISGGSTPSVLTSDTYDNLPASLSDVTISVLNSSSSDVVLDPLTGIISVNAGTPAGVYTVEYQICETVSPSNCSTITETITVEVDIIESQDDSASGVNGANGAVGILNVFDNDTLNTLPFNPADVTLTETIADPNGALTLNSDGSVDVAPGTAAGTYQLTYEICQIQNPSNCSTSVVTVDVDPPIIQAIAESFSPINGISGGTTTSVLTSDSLNGQPASLATVTLTVGASDPELVLNPNTGLITVAAGTAIGTYMVEYTICEILNPTNCSTVIETVEVTPPQILAAAESTPTINGGNGGVTPSVLTSDTLDGQPVTLADVTIILGVSDPELVLDPNTGLITVAPETLPGTYSVEYTICEILNPTNCSTTTEMVLVEPARADFSITKTNTPGANGEIDQASDTLTSGQTTTYTITVTNNGPDGVAGALITDVVGAGLTCPPTNPLTLSDSGVPAGNFTIADLTGAGISLGRLDAGEATTISYSCLVN